MYTGGRIVHNEVYKKKPNNSKELIPYILYCTDLHDYYMYRITYSI